MLRCHPRCHFFLLRGESILILVVVIITAGRRRFTNDTNAITKDLPQGGRGRGYCWKETTATPARIFILVLLLTRPTGNGGCTVAVRIQDI